MGLARRTCAIHPGNLQGPSEIAWYNLLCPTSCTGLGFRALAYAPSAFFFRDDLRNLQNRTSSGASIPSDVKHTLPCRSRVIIALQHDVTASPLPDSILGHSLNTTLPSTTKSYSLHLKGWIEQKTLDVE